MSRSTDARPTVGRRKPTSSGWLPLSISSTCRMSPRTRTPHALMCSERRVVSRSGTNCGSVTSVLANSAIPSGKGWATSPCGSPDREEITTAPRTLRARPAVAPSLSTRAIVGKVRAAGREQAEYAYRCRGHRAEPWMRAGEQLGHPTEVSSLVPPGPPRRAALPDGSP